MRRSNLSEREFEANIRAEISRTLVQGAAASAVQAPDIYVNTLLNYIGERRNFAWVLLSADDLAEPIPEPTDADLRAFFEANEEDFMLPETRKITYVALTPDMLVDTVEVAEDELRQLYDERIDEYRLPERRLVERLVLGAAAEEAKARLDAGELTFDELVAERDLELSDIDLGDVT